MITVFHLHAIHSHAKSHDRQQTKHIRYSEFCAVSQTCLCGCYVSEVRRSLKRSALSWGDCSGSWRSVNDQSVLTNWPAALNQRSILTVTLSAHCRNTNVQHYIKKNISCRLLKHFRWDWKVVICKADRKICMCCIPRTTALLHTGQLLFNFIHAIHTYLTTLVFIPAVFESELLPVKVQVQWTDADSGSEHQLREHQSRLPPSSRGSSASTCLLFLLLFSLGIPAREVPPASGTRQLYYHFICLQVVCETSDSWVAAGWVVKAFSVVLFNKA